MYIIVFSWKTNNPTIAANIHNTLADAGFATSLYFIFRTAGCFLGAFILQKMAPRTFFLSLIHI